MARKAPGTLIHCDACGEDYSATYKRCPFCGEKPGKSPTAPLPPVDEDDYVFEGGDVFDEENEDEQDGKTKGGKRLVEEESGVASWNWVRLVTFICSLVIIAAALVIVFAYVYPKIHRNVSATANQIVTDSNLEGVMPTGEGEAVSGNGTDVPSDTATDATTSPDVATDEPTDVTDQPSDAVATAEPAATDDVQPTDAQTTQTPAPSAASGAVTALSLSKTDVTLKGGETFTLKATVAPSSWSGTVTWSSSNENVAKVSASGVVTNVNTGSDVRSATITATADGKVATCIVRCQSSAAATATAAPAASTEPASSDTPAASTEPTTATSGALSLNRTDFTMKMGETFTLKATGADSVTWSVGNSGIATISDTGVVTPVAAGQTTITATSADGQTVSCIVRVKN